VAATSPSSPSAKPRWKRWVLTGVIAVIVLVVAVPFVYFTFIEGDPPPKLSLSEVTTTTGAAGSTGTTPPAGDLAGTWNATSDSEAGYRVEEQLFGQHNTAAGRTNQVTGTMTIEGTTVNAVDLTVDVASITSTDAAGGRRDDQFRGRIMDTDQFPTATFELTKPVRLGPIPKDGVEKRYSATGKLTMHGTTKTITIPITAKRAGDVIAVQGITDITFSDYDIDNPSGGPASVGNKGQLEFLVQFAPAAPR
jgi:polyisoprenoid-binding protein YceI